MEEKLHNKEIMDRLKGFNVPWEKDKDEAFKDIIPLMDKKPVRRTLPQTAWFRAAAAVGIVLISTVLFLRFFERDLECGNGEFLSHQLPDGSLVELNSASTIKYNPYWWTFSRSLRFEGDAWFVVQKGKTFTVKSELAQTEVLGTSFSIHSRNDNYRVICHTGKVQVSSPSESAILTQNQEAELLGEGKIDTRTVEMLPEPAPWKERMFKYTGDRLKDVIDELERQYDVIIKYSGQTEYYYTGNVNINRDFETSLDLVCKPFEITFTKISEGVYQLFENPDKNY